MNAPTTTTSIAWATLDLPEGGQVVLEALRSGSGRPRTVVLTTLHGDEVTPLYVLEHLLGSSLLEGMPGTLDVVPIVNWPGVLTGSRNFCFSRENLNRLFTGKPGVEGGCSVVRPLEHFLDGADLVLDLHNWDGPTAIVGIYYDSSDEVCNRASRAALAAFACDYVWMPALDSDFDGTFGAWMAGRKAAYAAIELPPPWLVGTDELVLFAERLAGVLMRRPSPHPDPPTGGRHAVTASAAGLLSPLVSPGMHVDCGLPLAHILSASSLRIRASIYSPVGGILLHLSPRRFVHKGECIGYIGYGTATRPLFIPAHNHA